MLQRRRQPREHRRLIRTYGIGSSPAHRRFIATKIKSPSKTILGGFILSIAVLVGFILFPQDPSGAMVASILVVVFGFTTYGAFSIGSSPLSEVKIPMAIFGTAPACCPSSASCLTCSSTPGTAA